MVPSGSEEVKKVLTPESHALGKLDIIKEKVFALSDLVTLCSVLSDSLQPHGL